MKLSKKILMIFILLITLFVIGYCVYYAIEGTYRAFNGEASKILKSSYWALKSIVSVHMAIIGGFLLIILGFYNEIPWIRKNCNVFSQSALGSLTITVLELISGIILNLIFGFNIWSYEGVFLNILGQICLPFSIIWFFISPFVFWLDDTIRAYFDKNRKSYSLIEVYSKLFSFKEKTYFQKVIWKKL